MNNSNTDGSPKGPLPSTAGETPADFEHAKAERRRAGLHRLMDEHGKNPADIARLLGLPTANALYNLLQGRSSSLSLDAIERLLAAFPEVTFEELVGLPPRRVSPAAANGPENSLITTIEACAGTWRRRPDLPLARRTPVVFPDGFRPDHPGAFLVLSQDPSADLLYPIGSLLVCRPVPALREDTPSGSRIIVRRLREGRYETTVRELLWDGQHAWLCPRSSRPEHQAPVRIRPPLLGSIPGRRGEEINIIGIVFASLQKERIGVPE